LVLENFIPQDAFACTTILATFLSDVLWKSGPNWVKDIFSGNKFVSKSRGFFSFCSSAIAISIFSIAFEQLATDFLRQIGKAQPILGPMNNVDALIAGFVILSYLYWNQRIYSG
jgi:hypothetical protein